MSKRHIAMSSEHEETVEQSNESVESIEGEINESPQPKKFHGDGPNEHAKPKRRGRRGKKRKHRKSSGSGAPCPGEHQEECRMDHSAECEKHVLSWDSEEEDLEVEDYHQFSDVIIRPINVPKAPENSTQFIIDDHAESRLYVSFETPNPYLADYLRGEEDDSEIIEPEGEDAAYVDINYEYESPHDFDNSAYYDREFELSYKNNRFDELMRLPRSDLISGLLNFEEHLKELNEDLVKEDPDPILERLQTELLELQEKHIFLKEQNTTLRTYLGDHQCSMEESEAIKLEPEEDIISEAKSNQNNTLADEGLVLQNFKESTVEQSDGRALVSVNEKQNRDCQCHVTRAQNSDKENKCDDEINFQESSPISKTVLEEESCHKENGNTFQLISPKEKNILRESDYLDCDENVLNAVPEEHELNAVTV